MARELTSRERLDDGSQIAGLLKEADRSNPGRARFETGSRIRDRDSSDREHRKRHRVTHLCQPLDSLGRTILYFRGRGVYGPENEVIGSRLLRR